MLSVTVGSHRAIAGILVQRGHPRRAAFTLVELLVVMGIIAILLALVVPALTRNSAAQLSTAGNALVSLAEVSRQHSMTYGGTTAMVVVKTFPSDTSQEYRAMTSIGAIYNGGNPTWVQLSNWKRLPTGIIIDPSASTFLPASVVLNPPLPSGLLKIDGKSISRSDIEVVVFDNLGRLTYYPGTTSARVRLVAGVRASPGVTYTGGDQGANHYDVIFNEATGRPLSVRR